jgi:hypothetical protein
MPPAPGAQDHGQLPPLPPDPGFGGPEFPDPPPPSAISEEEVRRVLQAGGYITFPFAVTETVDEKTQLKALVNIPEHMILATIFTDVEGDRKHRSFLSRSEEQVVFVAPIWYPIAIVPWLYDRDLVMDPMGVWEGKFDYERVADTEILVNELNSVNDIEDMKGAMARCRNALSRVAAKEGIPVKGLFIHEEFMGDLLAHMHLVERAEARRGFLRPRMDRERLESTVNTMRDLIQRTNADLGRLNDLSGFIHSKVGAWEATIDARIDQVTKDYDTRIDALRPEVEGNVKELEARKEEEIRALRAKIADLEREVARLGTEVEKHHQEYERLRVHPQKRVEAERARALLDQARQAHKGVKQRVHDAEAGITQADKQFKTLIAREWDRINSLVREKTEWINALTAEKQAMQNAAADLLSYINDLLGRKRAELEHVESQGVVTPPFSRSDFVYLPFYVALLDQKGKRRYLVYPPMVAKKGKGIVDSMKSTFGGIVLPLEPKTKQFEQVFKTGIEDALSRDHLFVEEVNRAAAESSAFNRADIQNVLLYGLEEMKRQGWITDKHVATLKERFQAVVADRPKAPEPGK